MWYRESFNSPGSRRHVGRWTNTVICWPHSKLSAWKCLGVPRYTNVQWWTFQTSCQEAGRGGGAGLGGGWGGVPAAVRYLLWLPVCQRDDSAPLLLVCETLTRGWLADLLQNLHNCQTARRKHGGQRHRRLFIRISGVKPEGRPLNSNLMSSQVWLAFNCTAFISRNPSCELSPKIWSYFA